VSVGHPGGRWELDYTDHDLSFARDVMTAVIDGRLSERTAFARSAVTITLPDGATHTEVGYDSCLGALVPQPRWRTHGTLIRPAPYRRGRAESP